MKKILIATLLIILSISKMNAQIPFYLNNEFETKSIVNDNGLCSHAKSEADKYVFKEKLQAENHRPYNVLTYDVFLDWQEVLADTTSELTESSFSGIQKISLEITESGVASIQLDAGFLKIKAIYLNGYRLEYVNQPTDSILTITLDKSYNSGEIVNLKIEYEYYLNIDFKNIQQYNYGFYLYPKGNVPWGNLTINNYHRLAYTFSQPEYARYWMPCNDVPDDKAIASVAIKVPEGFSAGSNGLLDSTISGENNTGKFKIFYWSDNNPIPPYLILAFASEYMITTDYYVRNTAPHDSIPILNYFWEEDYDSQGSPYNAKNSLKPTSSMMSYFSKLFGEYPTRKYGQCVLQPFSMGGMEHQTLSTINREWLKGQAENGVAHELAHQWIGDLVTCKTWQDIWLNEGGASWAEALWEKGKADAILQGSGDEAYNKQLRGKVSSYLGNKEIFDIPVYGIPTKYIFSYTGITYTKASWVYNMLYQQLNGPVTFIDFLKYLYGKYRFSNVSTAIFHDELKAFLNQNQISFDVDLFFDQWVYGSGHPIYYLSLNYKDFVNGNYHYDIKCEQAQNQLGLREVFICPVQIQLFKNGILKATLEYLNDKKVQTESVSLDFTPDSIAINRDLLLCAIWSNVLDIKDTQILSEENIYPNPTNDYCQISFKSDNFENADLELYDSFGKMIYKEAKSLVAGTNKIALNFSTYNLSNGVYFIYLKSDSKLIKSSIVVIK